MKFLALEAKHLLVKTEWSFSFPTELLKVSTRALLTFSLGPTGRYSHPLNAGEGGSQVEESFLQALLMGFHGH